MRHGLVAAAAALTLTAAAAAQYPPGLFPGYDQASVAAGLTPPAPPPAPHFAPPPAGLYAAPAAHAGPHRPQVGPRLYGNFEYLIGFIRSAPGGPPLVTRGSPIVGNAFDFTNTPILEGGRNLEYDRFPAFRIFGGLGLGGQAIWRLEGGGFYLPRQGETFTTRTGPTGDPLLFRPFTNALNGNAAGLAISDPGFATGGVLAQSDVEVWGMEANLVRLIKPCHLPGGVGVTFIGGFRYLDLEESLDLFQSTELLPGQVNPLGGGTITGPAAISLTDSFETRNQFYGGQFGARLEYCFGRVFTQFTGKVALGTMRQTVEANGVTESDGGAVFPGGLLVQPTNAGRFERNEFAVVPEGIVRVGYKFTDHFAFTLGYSFLYASDVVRPGDQIDGTINPGQIPAGSAFGTPGPARPAVRFDSTDVWVQAIHFGFIFRY